jgi:predicted CXXCH cytochrome family protein
MAHSLRRATNEPSGTFTDPVSGTAFIVRSGPSGTSIRRQHGGEGFDYPVAWAIGSGRHASGFLVQVDGHLFQAPICYYTNRRAYGLAPGYEHLPDPDFTRPVGEECVLCHSGRPMFQRGTANRYEPPVFAAEAISCERCHGPVEEHLRRPVPGSIVNPAKLAPSARDSVCEQCHLAGAVRILNPGRDFTDFRPGVPLESVFTVYVRAAGATGRPFKVISHAEQLAQSACARNSHGNLWCGTCHDPHAAAAPTAQTFSAVCQSCHKGKLEKSHPAGANCVSCHMTRRQAQDGGHTVFTDHRISRRPSTDDAGAPPEELAAWREPDPALQTRNMALAYVKAGIAARSPAQIVRGYRMLTEVQRAAPDDLDVLRGIGRALLLGKEPAEALKAFTRVLELEPGRSGNEEDVGVACFEAGNVNCAAAHLERALQLDPLRLSAADALQEVYRKQGDSKRAAALANSFEKAIGRDK